MTFTRARLGLTSAMFRIGILVVFLQLGLVSSSLVFAAEKPQLKIISAQPTVDGHVQVTIQTTIPTPIEVMVSVDLDRMKPDDRYIGTSKRVRITESNTTHLINVSKVKLGLSEPAPLPEGSYHALVSYHTKWSATGNPAAAKAVSENFEISSPSFALKNSESKASEVQTRMGKQFEVMQKISIGDKWNLPEFAKTYGAYTPVEVTNGNPKILKGYYFSEIQMTVIVNALKQTVSTWHAGAPANLALQPHSNSIHSAIPSIDAYTIISSNVVPKVKLSLILQLNKKVTLEQLRDMATSLKAQSKQRYDRIFISYYLPGMVVGDIAWATSHFDPELKVQIYGLSISEESKLLSMPIPSNSRVVGRWLTEASLGRLINVYQKDGVLFLEEIFKDGSSSKIEILEAKSAEGIKFSETKSSRYHWIVNAAGHLEVRDKDGIIYVARKID